MSKPCALKPDYAEGYFNLGIILTEARQPQEAIKHYEQALRLRPDYPEAHHNLGILLNEAERPREAIKHFEQALRLKPDYTDAHNSLARSWVKQVGRKRQLNISGKPWI